MKWLIPYIAAVSAIAIVAVTQHPTLVASSPSPEHPTQPNEAPRRLTINVSVTDPDDLKVTAGDHISVGELIADRTRERQQSTITPGYASTVGITNLSRAGCRYCKSEGRR